VAAERARIDALGEDWNNFQQLSAARDVAEAEAASLREQTAALVEELAAARNEAYGRLVSLEEDAQTAAIQAAQMTAHAEDTAGHASRLEAELAEARSRVDALSIELTEARDTAQRSAAERERLEALAVEQEHRASNLDETVALMRRHRGHAEAKAAELSEHASALTEELAAARAESADLRSRGEEDEAEEPRIRLLEWT
jgi:chromosome segregation ATPase